MVANIRKVAESLVSIPQIFVSIPQILVFSCFSVLRWGHLEAVAELLVEGCAVGEAAHLGNKGDGVVGAGQQAGGMIHAVGVDEGLGTRAVRALADGFVDVAVVGAEHRGKRVAVQVGISIALLLSHQLCESEEELLVGCALLFGLLGYALDVVFFALLLALNQLKEFAILDDYAAVGNGQSPQGNENDEHDGDEREGDDAIGVGLGAVVRRPAFRAGSKGQHG